MIKEKKENTIRKGKEKKKLFSFFGHLIK